MCAWLWTGQRVLEMACDWWPTPRGKESKTKGAIGQQQQQKVWLRKWKTPEPSRPSIWLSSAGLEIGPVSTYKFTGKVQLRYRLQISAGSQSWVFLDVSFGVSWPCLDVKAERKGGGGGAAMVCPSPGLCKSFSSDSWEEKAPIKVGLVQSL